MHCFKNNGIHVDRHQRLLHCVDVAENMALCVCFRVCYTWTSCQWPVQAQAN
jgi:hypothetical protein